MIASELNQWLKFQDASGSIIEMRNDLVKTLPEGLDLEADIWNIFPWLKKVRNSTVSNINFSRINNIDLKLICKMWVLHTRLICGNSSYTSYAHRIITFEALSSVLGARQLKTLKTDDFHEAEKWLSKKYTAPYRLAGFLQQASNWLSISFNMRLEYKTRLSNPEVHGRYGTEAGREQKLIPNDIIRDILKARHREDLINKDKFYLSVLTITIATGFRVGELATLPANCMLKINDKLHLLHYPEKGGVPVPRPIHPMLSEVVEDAVKNLFEATENARKIAKQLRVCPQLDWAIVLRDLAAFRYFTEKWANEWTSAPFRLMINPDGAWYTSGKRFVDAIGAYEAAGNNKVQAAKNLGLDRNTFSDLMAAQEAARRGELPTVRNRKALGKTRTSWDTDQRVISMQKLEEHCGIKFRVSRREVVQDIIDHAKNLQLSGKKYPSPKKNAELEERFERQIRPLLKDKNGNSVLYQDEALLIIEKYALSEQRSTKEGDFKSLTDSDIIRWLSGELRSHGTRNSEDSIFNRLGIIDPRTGDIAKFTTHDIRHWLNTIYQNGGLSEDQIALIFNRKYKIQNARYDQTSNKVRTARLKQAVRDNLLIGQVQETYNRIADYSREDAEDYLRAGLRMTNPMPHGECKLSWASIPCPHQLSCFSCNDEAPCEHLVVDPKNEDTTKELERMQRESNLMISAIQSQGIDDSPTLDHFRRVNRNVSKIIDKGRSIIIRESEDDETN